MTRWVYKMIQLKPEILSVLDRLGMDGWELCCIVKDCVFLKKPLNDLSMRESNTRQPCYKLDIKTYSEKVEEPEVDLKKEIDLYFKEWAQDESDSVHNGCAINANYQYVSINDCHRIAHHFFELGQKTQYQKDRYEFAKLKVKEWQDGFNDGVNARKEK